MIRELVAGYHDERNILSKHVSAENKSLVAIVRSESAVTMMPFLSKSNLGRNAWHVW